MDRHVLSLAVQNAFYDKLMKHNNSIKDKLDKRFQASKKTKNDIIVEFDQG